MEHTKAFFSKFFFFLVKQFTPGKKHEIFNQGWRQSLKQDFKSLEEFSFAGPMVRRMTGEQIWDSLVTDFGYLITCVWG